VTSFPDGKAKLNVHAKGYRAQDVELAIASEAPERVVKLERSRALFGRVLDSNSVPIAGARITAG